MDINDELKDLENRIYNGEGYKDDKKPEEKKEPTYDEIFSSSKSKSRPQKAYDGPYEDISSVSKKKEGTYKSQFEELKDDLPQTKYSDTDSETFLENQQTQMSKSGKKKKSPVQKTIIIAAIILVVAVIGYFVFYAFFAHSIVGDWSYTGSDEFEYHYSFDKSGKVTMTLGTIEFAGEYSTTKTDEGMNTTINLYYGEIGGDLSYTVSGSKILGNQVLTLKGGETDKVLTQTGKLNFKEILPVPEDHKVDESLIGEWEYTFEDYQVTYKFIFNNDGTMQINQNDSVIYNCVYSAESGKITCKFVTTEETEQEIEYSCDGTTLNIMGLTCSRAGQSTVNQVSN